MCFHLHNKQAKNKQYVLQVFFYRCLCVCASVCRVVVLQVISIIPHFHWGAALHVLICETHMVIYPPTPPGTHTHMISLLCSPACMQTQRQIAAVAVDGIWVGRISEALEPVSITLISLTREMREMINAHLSCSRSFCRCLNYNGLSF